MLLALRKTGLALMAATIAGPCLLNLSVGPTESGAERTVYVLRGEKRWLYRLVNELCHFMHRCCDLMEALTRAAARTGL